MDTKRWEQVLAAYQAVADVEPDERAVRLREACGGDQELEREVVSLLDFDSRAGGFLESTASLQMLEMPQATNEKGLFGRTLGEFTIRGVVGRGGMSVVYDAEQANPRRRVALKVLRSGPLTDEVTLRLFRRETTALARLDHPGIAVIHGAGTEENYHYFAMEFVDGRAITNFVRDRDLPIRDRLLLFRKVCDAVQYAHQRGVVHRDLKPSNILVTATGEPKVLDFGIARLLDAETGVTVHVTQPGVILGTLAYMSPEQARGDVRNIDTRSDVYSLGIILYELLTGCFPYPTSGQMADVLKHIMYTPAAPPRRSWSKSSGVVSQTWKRLGRVKCPIDSDVQTILLKALAKEQDRRYQAPKDLAIDIQCYLSGDAIYARRDSTLYLLRKLLVRHRVAVAIASTCVMCAGIAAVATHHARSVEGTMYELKRQDAMDDALINAMTGDFEGAKQAIEQAELLGASLGWIRMMRGQVAVYRGDTEEAVAHLEQATRLLPSSVTAKAMLTIALARHRSPRVNQQYYELGKLVPVTALDSLLMGYAISTARATDSALRLMDDAIRRRDSVVARLFRAEARTMRTFMTNDPADADRAIEDAAVARAMLPENPLASQVYLLAHLSAASTYELSGLSDKRASSLATAASEAERLGRLGGGSNTHRARALYFQFAGEEDAARTEAANATRWYQYAYYLYGLGEFQEALAALERLDPVAEDAQSISQRAFVLVELPDGLSMAHELYENSSLKSDAIWDFLALIKGRYLIERERDVVNACRSYIGKMPPLPDWLGWYRNLLNFAAQNLSPDELLAAAGASRLDRCEAHFFIAMNALSRGDRVLAKAHFQQAVDTGVFIYIEYQQSRAILRRMSMDPQWPSWKPTVNE